MENSPLVSVVIPAYNAGTYIEEAVRSVLDQDYPSLEVIVVDDGSTDDTLVRVAPFGSRVQCLRQSGSGGYPGVPRNAGMQRSKGEFICFLDADDIMCPGRLRLQIDYLIKHPQVGAVFTDYRNFSEDELSPESHFDTCDKLRLRLAGRSALTLTSVDATALLLQENFGIPSTMMIRHAVLDRVPGFSEALQTSEDFHFYFRVARQYDIGVLSEIGAHRRLHGENVTGNSLRRLSNYVASRADLMTDETSRSNRGLLSHYLRRCELDLAREYANRREYGKSIVHNLRAFRGVQSAPFVHLELVFRTLLRTAAIAVRLKNPDP